MGTLVNLRDESGSRTGRARPGNATPGDGSGGKAELPDGLWLDGDPQYRTRVMSAEGNRPQVLYPRALA